MPVIEFTVDNKAIETVAERYRSEGYQVVVRPNGSELPSFAAGLHLDLLATKGDERVLVEVKENREDLQNDPESVRMAEAINAQPGWRFDLYVLNAASPADKLARTAAEPSVDAILGNLDYVEKSARAGDHASSFVIAWAALEAAMRRAARAAGIQLQSVSPIFLLRTLYFNGLLEKSEFDRLNDSLRIRNVVVHGLEAPALDAAVPLYIASAARKLLAESAQETMVK